MDPELQQALTAYAIQLREASRGEVQNLQQQGVSPEALEQYAQQSLAARRQLIQQYAQQLLDERMQNAQLTRQQGGERDPSTNLGAIDTINVTPDGYEDLGTLAPMNIPASVKDTSLTDYAPQATSPQAIRDRRKEKMRGGS